MDWSERTIVGGGGPRYVDDDVIIAAIEFASACAELYEEKQRCPADDIMTVWTTAEIDGEPLGARPRDRRLPAPARRRRRDDAHGDRPDASSSWRRIPTSGSSCATAPT